MDKLVEPLKILKHCSKSLNDKRLEENVKYITKLLASIEVFIKYSKDIQRVIDSRPSDSLFLKSQDSYIFGKCLLQ